jgi:hypothetical protein
MYISTGPLCRLILNTAVGSRPDLDALKMISWPSEVQRGKQKTPATGTVLMHFLPPQYIPLYYEIINKICRNRSKFHLGNAFPFVYASGIPFPGLGLRLKPPEECIDICDEFLSSLKGKVDMTRVRVADCLHVPLSKGLSPEGMHNLLSKVKNVYPNGIPLGLACSMDIRKAGQIYPSPQIYFNEPN